MELKPYQQQVINDLALYLAQIQQHKTLPKSFNEFWTNHPKTPLIPTKGTAIEPYKDNIKGVPHICVKVPTAGGNTFIACNAIRTLICPLLSNCRAGLQHFDMVRQAHQPSSVESSSATALPTPLI